MELTGQQVIEVARTLFPAVERFRELDDAYRQKGLSTPLSVEHGWQKLKRVSQHAVRDQQHWLE